MMMMDCPDDPSSMGYQESSNTGIESFFRLDQLQTFKQAKELTPIFNNSNSALSCELFGILNTLPEFESLILVIQATKMDDRSISKLLDGIAIFKGASLKTFKFLADHNTLDSKLLQFIPLLARYKTLQQLTINVFNNDLGMSSNILINNLQNFKELQKLSLNLGYTGLGGQEIKTLGRVLQKLPLLEKFTFIAIDCNCRDAGSWFQFTQGISSLHRLKALYLNLDSSNISHEVGAMIASSYKNLISLTKLKIWLRLNEIKTETALHFTAAFAKLENLQRLDLQLDHNLIMDQYAFKIARNMIVSNFQTSTSLFMEGECEDIGGTTEDTLEMIDEQLEGFNAEMTVNLLQLIVLHKEGRRTFGDKNSQEKETAIHWENLLV